MSPEVVKFHEKYLTTKKRLGFSYNVENVMEVIETIVIQNAEVERKETVVSAADADEAKAGRFPLSFRLIAGTAERPVNALRRNARAPPLRSETSPLGPKCVFSQCDVIQFNKRVGKTRLLVNLVFKKIAASFSTLHRNKPSFPLFRVYLDATGYMAPCQHTP